MNYFGKAGLKMIELYKSFDGIIKKVNDFEDNVWANLVNPTKDEILRISEQLGIDTTDIAASLDDEEASRLEVTDGYTLVIIDIPIKEERHGNDAYTTMPLAIIITDTATVTVCLQDSLVLRMFTQNRIKGVSTTKKMRFLYQILFSNATVYQNSLRVINRRRENIESRLSKNTRNSDLIELHELEKNLVYFATSLRFNSVVLDKLTRYEKIKQYPEDKELLDDVLIENKQAIEMTNIYRDIINGTRELFSSVIDNSLNTVMKFLASITLVMSIPNIISGLYGMNVNSDGVPLAESVYGFGSICGVIFAICLIAILILRKKDLL